MRSWPVVGDPENIFTKEISGPLWSSFILRSKSERAGAESHWHKIRDHRDKQFGTVNLGAVSVACLRRWSEQRWHSWYTHVNQEKQLVEP